MVVHYTGLLSFTRDDDNSLNTLPRCCFYAALELELYPQIQCNNLVLKFLPPMLLFFGLEVTAAFDAELASSLKCVSLFRHSEYKQRIPADTLYSISLNETGRLHSTKKVKLSWPWTVNVEGQGHFFNTRQEAVHFVKKQIALGKESIDVGCMQVNLKHHPDAFKSVEEAFDPRANIAYAASFLRSKYDQLGCWHKAIAHYHSATETLGTKYKNNVITIAKNIEQYKDMFRQHARTYSNNKAYNQILERSYNKKLSRKVNPVVIEKRQRSNMMVHVPKAS